MSTDHKTWFTAIVALGFLGMTIWRKLQLVVHGIAEAGPLGFGAAALVQYRTAAAIGVTIFGVLCCALGAWATFIGARRRAARSSNGLGIHLWIGVSTFVSVALPVFLLVGAPFGERQSEIPGYDVSLAVVNQPWPSTGFVWFVALAATAVLALQIASAAKKEARRAAVNHVDSA